jgi:catechol 2,3-dioxygenase-like lactoylglutathione lyase family enzyme
MPVLGILSYTLEVPDIEEGVRFYEDAGLISDIEGDVARLRCRGQDRDVVVLLGNHPAKRLHHVSLRADGLGMIERAVPEHGGALVATPEGSSDNGVWVTDPHGMLLHLSDAPADPELAAAPPFEINAPGRLVRKGRSAMLASEFYSAVVPLRLGHVLVFSPDVPASVRFVTEALGMGLADHAKDVLAFCCARRNSDHHVLAFAKSPAVGFHHGSFQVNDPDDVGRGGRALVDKTGRGDWGFGRHTIGSNFFHYIQDPWGSWFEYYSDIDYIEDYAMWKPTNYELKDSLANWGPRVPDDFVHNYEAIPTLDRVPRRMTDQTNARTPKD